MKKRRQEVPEERRKERVEINLLGEDEGGGARELLSRTRRGCTLPFTVIGLALVAGLELVRSVLI
jgi:hypothetical protein